ncbi:MAG TPA: DUF998 domain-containing protein [Solirubrobacteraceae bacterium]|nr:DUF998 domain-containing protein [Solirubrobacteraceae bacterium]
MTTIAGVIALVALAAVIASLGYLHLAPTGLSPVRNAVSQYGITSFRAGYRVATIAFALAALALAFGLHRALQGDGQLRLVVVLLIVFAIARALITWFPMDAPGTPHTTTGARHGMLAIVAFAAATIAALRLGSTLSRGMRWHSLAPVSSALGWAMLACLLAMALARGAPALRERFGAIERAFYLAAIAWFGVFGVACLAGA